MHALYQPRHGAAAVVAGDVGVDIQPGALGAVGLGQHAGRKCSTTRPPSPSRASAVASLADRGHGNLESRCRRTTQEER